MGSNDAGILSNMEIDAIGEILNISLGSSATSVSQLLGKPVNITTPEVKLIKTKDFDIKTYEPAIGVEINYVKGLDGKNILILKESDVKVIVGLLLQTDFSDKEFVLDEMNIGAICEVMNQMMGASATALSQFLNRSINISPPSSFPVDNSEQFKSKYLEDDGNIVAVYFNLMIGDMVNSQFINLMKVDFAKELVSNFGLNPPSAAGEQPAVPAKPVAAPAPKASAQPAAAAAPSPKVSAQPAAAAAPSPKVSAQPAAAAAPAPKAPAQPATVAAPVPAPAQPATVAAPVPAPAQPTVSPAAPPQPYSPAPQPAGRIANAVYPSFDADESQLTESESNNLNMIMSVPLQITVEIGRTTKKIKEILDFSAGTIVELNRQAGSQVDVYVNGKAIAKGNVVVVDDNYGVRITEVINSEIMKLSPTAKS
ncbi:MAG: flagellar motor switch phosphatase FliY [Oscillospiraceae bacterium]|nr:flagellar motor switch phosphatase FliY [Oscillospiraceae bacterium]MCI2034475.1 flagellar motor switch phosphatase FliY [Oscillospiraceae bacterium]